MQIKKYKIIYVFVLSVYLFFAFLNPILHNHIDDGHDHDNCQSCNWVAVTQVQGAAIVTIGLLLFLLFVLAHPKTTFKPINVSFVSSRAPPLILI